MAIDRKDLTKEQEQAVSEMEQDYGGKLVIIQQAEHQCTPPRARTSILLNMVGEGSVWACACGKWYVMTLTATGHTWEPMTHETRAGMN